MVGRTVVLLVSDARTSAHANSENLFYSVHDDVLCERARDLVIGGSFIKYPYIHIYIYNIEV